jgi:hypothetical protein
MGPNGQVKGGTEVTKGGAESQAAPDAAANEVGTASSPAMKRIAWILRAIILASGIYQTIFGETAIGILTLLCLGAITAPDIVSRGRVAFFPIEVEIVLFVMVIIQYVLGEARDFYTTIPYYDKFVHATLPGLVGYLGFLLAYSMVASGKLIAATSAIVTLIILMSLGIGAAEEIAEYASDTILYPRIPGWHHFQGNAQEDPHTDTMNDLVADLIGAIFGALLGVWFIGRAVKRGSRRLPAMVEELQTMSARPTEAKDSG